MSHYYVLARLPGASTNVEQELRNLLDPYREEDDRGRLRQYFEFQDEEDENLLKYTTGGTEMVRVEGGELVSTYDNRFRKDVFAERVIPDHLERVYVAHTEKYQTFEEFMKDYCGMTRDESKGRYGFWTNPNAKWDWYVVGGRYQHRLRTATGRVDVCRISELDYDALQKDVQWRCSKFWSEVAEYLACKEFEPFEGPREALIDMGLLTCGNAGKLTGREFWTNKWKRQVNGEDMYDVVEVAPDPVVHGQLVADFMNQLRPYAYVDKSGWRERVGSYGSATDAAEPLPSYMKDFYDWIKSGDQNDWIVVVDCHN